MIILVIVLVCIIIALLWILFMIGSREPDYATHVIRQILFNLKEKIPDFNISQQYWDGYRDALSDVERNINESEGNE